MKVILYLAQTVNGMIAKEDDDTPWSQEEWQAYADMAKMVGNIIIGRRTYELMMTDNSFDDIGNPQTVVLTSNKEIETKSGSISFADSPQNALLLLESRNVTTVIVGGGAKTNSSFLKENLIDEIILDVEPLIFGRGIALFASEDFEAKLELLKTKKLNQNTIQLHYKVLK